MIPKKPVLQQLNNHAALSDEEKQQLKNKYEQERISFILLFSNDILCNKHSNEVFKYYKHLAEIAFQQYCNEQVLLQNKDKLTANFKNKLYNDFIKDELYRQRYITIQQQDEVQLSCIQCQFHLNLNQNK